VEGTDGRRTPDLEVRDPRHPGEHHDCHPRARHTAIIPGLENGTEYRFTVTATNEMGDGPPSAPSNAVTPAERVVATRGNIKVRATFTPRSGKFDALLVDPIPPDGLTFLDANLAFAWNDPAGGITVDLGQAQAPTRITFQADNNDSYIVEFSVDGKTFGDPQVFAGEWGTGAAHTRDTCWLQQAGAIPPHRWGRRGHDVRDGGA
jgi:hypothetical protein